MSTSSAMVTKQAEASGGADMESFTTHGGNVKKRRTTVPEKPNYPLSLWSIMKNCIGKIIIDLNFDCLGSDVLVKFCNDENKEIESFYQ